MNKHTPGPWHRNISAGGKYPTVISGRNTHVAVAKQMATPEETEANISLISAAPQLLAALESLVGGPLRYNDNRIEIDCADHTDAWERVKVARAAIAKAKEDQ